ncbi:hypothetical protein [Acidithiobacillus thiooxidans]|uniref:Uncharacterized protein n=1 Tax=Acidithiobacillus thiooxidans ATCC 19377 TaxID=637390 RepID=A0A5P9XUV0_ACITH|nr:hypothetical protein [Acidithiobacillus thiooxidans]QFX96986.1 hypothetical protein GCD22_02847 [Acidithiobacillus thiooxidans ATCC 19377]
MNAAHEKAPAGTEAVSDDNIKSDSRIPAAGFTVIHHLLYAAKNLHSLPALPDDAIQGARILLARIDADIARLDGAQ